MKIMYISDLHGSVPKYEQIHIEALKHEVEAVILGGDLFPYHGKDLVVTQLNFCEYLTYWMCKLTCDGIYLFYILGNDDLAIMDNKMKELLMNHDTFIHCIDHLAIEHRGYTFVGMSEVKDPPFGLKDRARLDYRNDDPTDVFQPHTVYLTCRGKWEEMPVEEFLIYIQEQPDLNKILWRLPVDGWEKTVLVAHQPPCGIGLDITYDGNQVGSQAVYNFIEDTQPLLSLHGHIHESPRRTGIWKTNIGKTICIQPGQPRYKLNYVIVDLVNPADAKHFIVETTFHKRR